MTRQRPETTAVAVPEHSAPTEVALLDAQPGLREAFVSMLEAVPEADDYAAARIVAQLLGAQNVKALNAPWDANGLEDYGQRPLCVDRIKRMPSDFGGGLEWFVVIEGRDAITGERVIVTTGSVSCVAQLVRAHSLGMFPCVVTPTPAKRPSKAGFTPWHLTFDHRVVEQ